MHYTFKKCSCIDMKNCKTILLKLTLLKTPDQNIWVSLSLIIKDLGVHMMPKHQILRNEGPLKGAYYGYLLSTFIK